MTLSNDFDPDKVPLETSGHDEELLFTRSERSSNGTEPFAGFPDFSDETDRTTMHNKVLGRKGEDAAAAFLQQKGFTILERNWHCRYGEADIIALEGDTLHFIEVKTRLSDKHGFPSEAITPAKRHTYELIAEIYLRNNDVPSNIGITFDAISLIVTGSTTAFLRFHRNVLTEERSYL